jgi:type IV pilus assembly protein PilW
MTRTMTRLTRSSAVQRSPRAVRGFTLIEIMIALAIGLFLTAGLLTLVQAMKRTSVTQAGMSQLQDNERMAMTLIADVIQLAGYFPQPVPLPNPPVSSGIGIFGPVAPFKAGQSLYGTGAALAPAPGDTITVRYQTGGTTPPASDMTINCTGNTSPTQIVFTNTFSLIADPYVAGTYDLACTLNGAAPVALVNGIKNLSILYGVKTNSLSNNSVDSYLDANAVIAGNGSTDYWNNVRSVKVTVTFVNPMYGTLPGQTTSTAPTIQFTRIVDVMNTEGVTS